MNNDMDISHFVNNLTDIFEDTDSSLITHDCIFKDLDEWNSLIALSVIAMIDEEYGVVIKGGDIRNAETVEDLFKIVSERK